MGKAVSKAAFMRALPVGRIVELTTYHPLPPARPGSNPRTVIAHRSFGVEFSCADGRISALRFDRGDKYAIDGGELELVDQFGRMVYKLVETV